MTQGLCCLLVLWFAAAMPAADLDQFFQPGKIRTLIISGRNNHDWRATTPFLRGVLQDSGRFDVRVTEEPAGLTFDAVMPYQLIVVNYVGPRWGHAAEHAVGSAVRSGAGLVVIHGSTYPFGQMPVLAEGHGRTDIREKPWKDYGEMVGATWTEKSGHGKRHIFTVKLQDRRHPITRGMTESFAISDELYHNLDVKEGVHVLATAYDDPAMNGTGEDEPLLWTLVYGKGRVFQTALGHDLGAMSAPGFVTTFARGAEWAATGKVTLPAEMHVEMPAGDPVRVQLVVGGHDFAPTLFKIFEGRQDIRTNVVYQPAAYTKGRLKSADVVVQYDMMQPITEEHRANLRRYLESGKGLVVLHHAVASYQDWEWWWRDVTGVRYVLKGQTDMPESSYKHDIWMDTETIAEHPVTRGIPPMRIYDESYKDMWFSPDIDVLIETDHPTSDGPLAWIGPYDDARVVVIQLGHGPEAHNHTHFQKLVQNAIRWAAGREEQ